jgi:hypothetical protein
LGDWLTFSIAKDVLLSLLAIYGAALSTFNWHQAVRKDQRAIKVSLLTAMPAYNDGHIGQCFGKIEATNIGHRAVTVTRVRLELPGGAHLISTIANGFPGMPDTPLPAALSDGQSAHAFLSYRDIAAALIQSGRTQKTKLMPVCEDSVGGSLQGRAMGG